MGKLRSAPSGLDRCPPLKGIDGAAFQSPLLIDRCSGYRVIRPGETDLEFHHPNSKMLSYRCICNLLYHRTRMRYPQQPIYPSRGLHEDR